MTYAQFLNLLAQRGNEVQGIHLGLHRMTAVMAALGSPHLGFPVIHIAGTNGKGSVAAMTESILRQAGWRTGLYTSPHLVRVEERIRVCGAEIQPRQLAAAAQKVCEAEEKLLASGSIDRHLTYFEILTASAFNHFATRSVDIAVVEVGLGGRLDATNIVSPKVCVITGVSYDHQYLLGETLAAIAGEKAGIIKAGVPVISGCLPRAGRSVIRKQAKSLEAPLCELDRDVHFKIAGDRAGHCIMDLQTPRRSYPRLRLSLAGMHQARNAALSVAAVEALDQSPAGPAAVRRGLARAEWPGRMDSYRARRRTLLDGAHNPEGARMLEDFLIRAGHGKIHLVFGALRDKDVALMARILFPLADVIHVAALNNSRALSSEEIALRAPRFRRRLQLHESASAALNAAWEHCPPEGMVVVAGSLYLIGELIEVVRKEAGWSRRAFTSKIGVSGGS